MILTLHFYNFNDNLIKLYKDNKNLNVKNNNNKLKYIINFIIFM